MQQKFSCQGCGFFWSSASPWILVKYFEAKPKSLIISEFTTYKKKSTMETSEQLWNQFKVNN